MENSTIKTIIGIIMVILSITFILWYETPIIKTNKDRLCEDVATIDYPNYEVNFCTFIFEGCSCRIKRWIPEDVGGYWKHNFVRFEKEV